MNIYKRGKDAFQHRDNIWMEKWDEVWSLTIPQRAKDLTNEDIGEFIHDSTAGTSMSSLANIILSGITPPWTKWFNLVPGPLVNGEDRKSLLDRLQLIDKIVFSEINNSNFIQAIQPAYLDAIMGTGSILIEPKDDNGIRYTNIPLGEYAIEVNYQDEISAYFHQRKMKGIEIKELYSPSEELEDERFYEIWIAIDSKEKPITKTVILASNGETLEETTLDWNPYIVFRWSKISGDPWGYGPALQQHYDNRYLNRIKELAAKGFALDVGGVYTMVDDGAVNTLAIRLQPHTILPVDSNDRQNPTIDRLNTATNVNVAQFEIETLRADIRKGFLADRFSPPSGEKFTATEIVMRSRLIAQELGATYGIIEKELLKPIVNITMKVLESQNKIPVGLIPDEKTIDVLYLSQLAQAQRVGDIENIMKYAQFAQVFAQFDPKVALKINAEKVMEDIGEKLNINSTQIRSKTEVKALVEQMNQQNQGGNNGGNQQGRNKQGRT